MTARASKSLSCNIGAVRVAETCEIIETDARQDNLDRSAPHIEALAIALDESLAALQECDDRSHSAAVVLTDVV